MPRRPIAACLGCAKPCAHRLHGRWRGGTHRRNRGLALELPGSRSCPLTTPLCQPPACARATLQGSRGTRPTVEHDLHLGATARPSAARAVAPAPLLPQPKLPPPAQHATPLGAARTAAPRRARPRLTTLCVQGARAQEGNTATAAGEFTGRDDRIYPLDLLFPKKSRSLFLCPCLRRRALVTLPLHPAWDLLRMTQPKFGLCPLGWQLSSIVCARRRDQKARCHSHRNHT